MENKNNYKLYLVLEPSMIKLDLNEFLDEVILNGVTAIQYRNKFNVESTRMEELDKINEYNIWLIQEKLKFHKENNNIDILFFIDDDYKLANKVGAYGVHVGIHDASPEIIKKEASYLTIGYSCNTIEDCNVAKKYADYAGIGPFTSTTTKSNTREILGVEGIYKLVHELGNMPTVAIGGIDLDNAALVMSSGVTGLAVSSIICGSNKPGEITHQLRKLVDSFYNIDDEDDEDDF